jgi:photosystem I subunit 3
MKSFLKFLAVPTVALGLAMSRASPARPTVAMAAARSPAMEVAGKVAGAALLGATLTLGDAANAANQPGSVNYAQLEDCAKSKGFAKRQRKTVATYQARLKKYEPGSPPYLALEQGLDQANSRFKRYADSNLLCGKDGLPHLIADGNPEYFAQFVFPGIGFLYTAGYIGTAGRKYIKTVAKTKNPAEKEIIIDVPLALTISLSNYLGPLDAWKEFLDGDLVADKSEITVSPR